MHIIPVYTGDNTLAAMVSMFIYIYIVYGCVGIDRISSD